MIKVFLREKKLLHGKKSLYLDFYPPIVNQDTQKPTRREHLRLNIYEKPKTQEERDHNKETKMLGESIRATRQLELQSGAYGFIAAQNKRKDFIAYFKAICESKKQKTKSTYGFWQAIHIHLKSFAGESVKFGDISEKFCRDFKDHLRYKADLSQNTAAIYFSIFKTVVKQAFERKLLSDNPAKRVRSIEAEETQREFLTLDELQKLAKTPFDPPVFKNAALFSALTGLRFSDIRKLTWGEIQQSKEQGFYIRFRQQKTKNIETHSVSSEAVELLGTRARCPKR